MSFFVNCSDLAKKINDLFSSNFNANCKNQRVKSVLKHYLCTKQATGSVPNTGKVYSGVSIGGRKLLKTESPRSEINHKFSFNQ